MIDSDMSKKITKAVKFSIHRTDWTSVIRHERGKTRITIDKEKQDYYANYFMVKIKRIKQTSENTQVIIRTPPTIQDFSL